MAGSLFCGREIFGNAALADEIENFSGNAYVCELPQSYEPRSNAPKAVRDCDYTHLLQCDAVIAAFDGLELDSGTVAEFITAKVADKPAILLRSDFRISGDQVSGGDPWNLMCSFYPRSTVLHFNFMQAYKDYLKESKNALAAAIHILGYLCRAKQAPCIVGCFCFLADFSCAVCSAFYCYVNIALCSKRVFNN